MKALSVAAPDPVAGELIRRRCTVGVRSLAAMRGADRTKSEFMVSLMLSGEGLDGLPAGCEDEELVVRLTVGW